MQLPTRLKGELVLPLARTFIARVIVALGGLLLLVVLGRLYGPSGVGVFALAQSVYLGAGILARYGMNNSPVCRSGSHFSCHQNLPALGGNQVTMAKLAGGGCDLFAAWLSGPMVRCPYAGWRTSWHRLGHPSLDGGFLVGRIYEGHP